MIINIIIIECLEGTFKSDIGNSQCKPCPLNSWTPSNGYKSCICNNGYFRPDENLINSPCIRKLFK